jgi:hypothetical protein
MDYPQYVRPIGGNALYYDRVIPKRLHSLTSERRIRIPLGLDSDSPQKAVQRATLDAQEEYESRIALLDSSSTETLSDDQIDQNVAALLRRLSAQPGLPTVRSVPINPDDLEYWRGKKVIDADGVEHVIDPDSPDIMASLQSMARGIAAGEILAGVDADPVIKERARRALIKGSKKKRRRISDLWQAWFQDVGERQNDRVKAKYAKYGQDLLSLTGDHYCDAADALDHVHRGMDEYVEQKLSEGAGKPGIEKALNLWCAAMRRGSKANRLRWMIEPPSLSHIRHRVKQKDTLDDEQQKVLLDNADCLEGALMLLELQTACMQSEVASLDLKKALKSLNHSTPYLLFNEDGEGKTEARRRASPVTVRPDLIRKWLPEIHEYLNRVTESQVSKLLTNWLTDLFGTHLTPHGAGRHTFKATALAASANPMHVAMIAGWSTGGVSLSDHMSRYGRAAIEKSEQLKALSETSRTMFDHLVVDPPSNVTPMRKRRRR